jgi:hypothetical protein
MAYRVVLALTTGVLVLSGKADSSQVRPVEPPLTYTDRASTDANISRYEALYGPPQFRALDDESARPWPVRTAIRTIGRLEGIPGRGKSGEASPGRSGGGEWDNPYAVYRLCGQRRCLALVPVEEMRGVFDGPASAWVGQGVEVIGAIDELKVPGADPRSVPQGFLVWSVFESPNAIARGDKGKVSSLETLVRYPKGAEGRVVTASGTFRGANLFEDLPSQSRRNRDDWVLQDGPFSVWVTSKAPKGKGWALDPQSRADCSWRLVVTGTVETAGGLIYLRAKSVTLAARTGPAP